MPRIYLSPPDISMQDHASVDAVLASNWVAPVGPHLEEFEKTVASSVGVKHALALSSGTAALHLALQVLGVGQGDEVICPSMTFAASANPVRYLGAEPVFVDSERRTWNMDPALLEKALQERSAIKAVIVVHLYGQCAEMGKIIELCRKYDKPLIEDAAEAVGASYQGWPAGSMGDIAFFSFNGNKIITTSGGGMLLSNHQEWLSRARYLSAQAREPVLHYEHREVGYNYRMSNVLAGLGLSQFSDLKRRISAKRAHFEAYKAAFDKYQNVAMMPIQEPDEANYWLSCLTLSGGVSQRDALIAALETEDIEARPVWKPLHLQPVFDGCVCYGGQVAESLFAQGICLPSGSGMSGAERQRVIDAIISFLNEGFRS
ncbi:pyridoxal phosphate-dependent aminotransferase [Coraliomargarita sinensis]|uniref:GDP-perosamine synthase n=1 Tax=Coraliomargarita sinensis TaxID=2174842 RepID=A0A317ZEQ2_9BACT|nr:aminotransferase class I/II-fold pyridoxal phosphate-dependent enzyme [Coraliomargarita sinensis]PXA03925.1 pyridoxal phosphate-dependent aminotransferase [Coraliomargarita sinensis]